MTLTLSWRRPLSYRNQSTDLLWKSLDWFLYDNGLHHERVKMSTAILLLECHHLCWLNPRPTLFGRYEKKNGDVQLSANATDRTSFCHLCKRNINFPEKFITKVHTFLSDLVRHLRIKGYNRCKNLVWVVLLGCSTAIFDWALLNNGILNPY